MCCHTYNIYLIPPGCSKWLLICVYFLYWLVSSSVHHVILDILICVLKEANTDWRCARSRQEGQLHQHMYIPRQLVWSRSEVWEPKGDQFTPTAIKTFGCSGPPLGPSPSVPVAPAGTGRHRSRAGHHTVLCKACGGGTERGMDHEVRSTSLDAVGGWWDYDWWWNATVSCQLSTSTAKGTKVSRNELPFLYQLSDSQSILWNISEWLPTRQSLLTSSCTVY